MSKSTSHKTFELRDPQTQEMVTVTAWKTGRGGDWRAQCPRCCEKTNAGLWINMAEGFKCHRGCGFQGHTIQEAGVQQDLILPEGFKKYGTPVAYYDYEWTDGELLFQVVRYDSKAFPKRRPNHNWKLGDPEADQWIPNMGEITVPYKLPEILACGVDTPIYLTEGEKDVETLMSKGLVATTNPSGAGGWKDALAKWFEHRDVIVIPDCDDDGKKHTASIMQSLSGKVKSLKVIELPGLPVADKKVPSTFKKDITDWFELGHTIDELLDLVARTEPTTKVPEPTLEIPLIDDFVKIEIPPRKSILSPWLKEKSIAMVAGWRGSGKTWFLLTALDAITRDITFGPWETVTPVPCLYVDGELNDEEVQERAKSIRPFGSRKTPLYLYNNDWMKQKGWPSANLLSKEWRKLIEDWILKNGIKVCVFDNLSAICGGDDLYEENAKRDWQPINSWLINLKHQGCSSILAHHTGYSGTQRGTTGREDNIDTSILLKQPQNYSPEMGCKFTLTFTKKRTKQSEAKLVQNYDFQLMETAGLVEWYFTSNKRNRDIEILDLLSGGVKQSAIAKGHKLQQSAISKLKNKFISKGWLTSDGKLTAEGEALIKSTCYQGPAEWDEEGA